MIEAIQKLIKPGPAVKLVAQIEQLVRDGRISPEALLPPVRELASAVGVSPGTVAAAYQSLRRQGVVSTDRRRGTRVLAPSGQQEYADLPTPPGAVDLQAANPDPRLLPDLHRIFAGIRASSESYGGSHLDRDLIEQMGANFEADGIETSCLLVTSGATAAIYRSLRACLKPGDKVAVEDPGFNEHHAIVRGLSMIPVPVGMDDEGLLPEQLSVALRSGAKAIILTPRFQSPTGAALSRARASQLRGVLSHHPEVAVLLDDYGSLLSEEKYQDCLGKGRSRWLVVRSLNKPVSPDLRVAVAAADAEIANRLQREQWLADGWVSSYLQRAAAAALASRSVQALLSRARQAYSRRRTELLKALAERGIEARGATGLNVWVPVADEALAVRGLLERGWCVRAGARYRLRSPPAIRITVAQLLSEQTAPLADALRSVFADGLGERSP
jgi:DNA-binding transcriptional MocR family regulator